MTPPPEFLVPFGGALAKSEDPKLDPPALVVSPGLSCTTLDVPSVQSKAGWASLLQLLSLADGMVVLRLRDTGVCDKDGYLAQSEFLSEVFEVVDSRPMFIVCVCTGPVRASMMAFVAMSTAVLATTEASFGFPSDEVHPITQVALRRRLAEVVLRRLTLVGDTVSAVEAQRLGLVDFVAGPAAVEGEVARLVYRNCAPTRRLKAPTADRDARARAMLLAE